MFISATLAVLAVAPLAADEAMADRLAVAAEPAALDIPPRNPGRQWLTLPSLEFRFHVSAECAAGGAPVALSLAVADSRVSLTEAALADTANRELPLTIPAEQLPPVALERFCVADDALATIPTDAGHELLVSAALSAHASLLCRSASHGDTMTYVTSPLGLRLVCAAQAKSP